MQKITIGPYDAGQRLDKFLAKYLKEAEKGFLYKMLRKKNITLNGSKADGAEKLAAGDEVTFFFSDETFEKFRGEALSAGSAAKNTAERNISAGGSRRPDSAGYGPLKASSSAGDASLVKPVYEDDQVIFMNKPAGMLSQKAEGDDVSLCEHLAAYIRENQNGSRSMSFVPGVANRLDRNTSGLVLAGKTLPGQQLLASLLKSRGLDKYYYAVVKGQPVGLIRSRLYWKKDEANNTASVLREAAAGAEPIEIEFAAERQLNDGFSLLRVKLITGRTHQIRAQLAFLGYPVLGDKKYGSERVNRSFAAEHAYPLRHQLLHAYEIVFPKAAAKEAEGLSEMARKEAEILAGKHFTAPLPLNFHKCLSFLGGDIDGR